METQKYDYHLDEYDEQNPELRFLAFSKNVTLIQGQEMLQEVEFWNPKKEEKKEERATQISPSENEDQESIEAQEKAEDQ